MKYLECPYCKKQVAKEWELLFGLPEYRRHKNCPHCKNDIRINFKTLYLMTILMALAILVSKIIKMYLPIPSIIPGLLVLVSLFIPFMLGKKLFRRKESSKIDKQ